MFFAHLFLDLLLIFDPLEKPILERVCKKKRYVTEELTSHKSNQNWQDSGIILGQN